MKLNDKQRDVLMTKLNELWKNKTCEICGNKNWMVDDTLFEIREFHGGKTILGSGALKPFITATCTNCGNTKFLNAIQLGIVDPKNPSGEEKKGGSHE